jgi:CrcB protein
VTVLLIALGAALGAPLRYLADRAIQRRHNTSFPWGTLTVNVGGSFVLGLVVGLAANPLVTALVGVGFCGALTTYSTFGYETVRLAENRERWYAAANVGFSLAGGLVAALAGITLGHALR